MISRTFLRSCSIILSFLVLAAISVGKSNMFSHSESFLTTNATNNPKTNLAIKATYQFNISWNERPSERKERVLNCDFKNSSTQSVSIDHCNFGPNHQIILKDVNGVEPKMTARGVLLKEAFQNGQNRDRNVPVVVKPGHSDRETITLDRYYELKPGKYRVKIRFREWASIPGVTPSNETIVIDIVSNELEFVINP